MDHFFISSCFPVLAFEKSSTIWKICIQTLCAYSNIKRDGLDSGWSYFSSSTTCTATTKYIPQEIRRLFWDKTWLSWALYTPRLNEKTDSGKSHLQDLARWLRTSQKCIFAHFPLKWPKCAIFWPSLTPPANPVKFFWSKMACTCVPHIVLHVSGWIRTSGGYFRPSEVRIRSILARFWLVFCLIL